jgi:hypothetical protein
MIFRIMSGKLDQVSELLPPTGWAFVPFYFSLTLSVLSLVLKRKWLWDDIFSALIVILLAGYALRHKRFINIFMVCAFPYAAREWLESRRRAALSARLASWERRALVVSCGVLLTTAIASACWIQGGVHAADSGYIREVCDFIASQKIPGPFYNEYKFGSYWIWRFQGNPPVFQDGRYDTVTGYSRVIEATLEAQKSPKTWNDYLDKLGVQAALVHYPSTTHGISPAPLDAFFPRTSWGLVYWDDLCLLFVRRDPRHAALLRQWEYRAIKPDWNFETFQYQLQNTSFNRIAARKEIERNLALNPGCRRAQADLYWLDRAHAVQ